MHSTGGGLAGKSTPRSRKALKAARVTRLEQNSKQIAYHEQHYKQNPRQHARALRSLGLSSRQVAAIHRDRFPRQVAKARQLKMTSAPGFKVPGRDLFDKTVGDFLDAAIYSPAGIYQLSKTLGGDVGRNIVRGAQGKPSDFHRSGRLGKELVRQSYQDLRHPGRHPGNAILTASALFGLGEGTVARAAAARGALREGEGVAGAVARKGYKGGSLLHRPTTGRVSHDVIGDHGRFTVESPASKRPVVAAIQRSHAKRRSAGPGAEKAAARHLKKEQRINEAIERAPINALAERSRKLSTPQQTALRVFNEGKSVPERVRFHEGKRDAAKGVAARRHQQKILLLKASEKYLGENGLDLKPVASATSRTQRKQLQRLHETQGLLDRVAKTREDRLAQIGKLEDGRIEARLHGPGRVIEGAHYEKPTPGKQGRSPGLERQRKRVASLEKRYNREVGKAVMAERKTRPRRKAEAQAFIDEVHGKYDQMVETIAAGEVKPKGVVVKRNARNAKLARRGAQARQKMTLSDEARLHAERQLQKLMHESKHPSVVRMREQLAEADRLQAELGQKGDILAETAPRKGPPKLGRVERGRNPRRSGAQRLGGALSVAKDELQRMEAAAGARVKPTGLVGAEDFHGGHNRIPYTAEEPPRSHNVAATYRGGVPQELPSVTHEFKGGLLQSGNFRDSTAKLVAESGAEAQRHTAVLRLRDRVVSATRDKPREGDIAIRLDSLGNKPFPDNVRAVLRKREEGVKLTRGEAQLMRDELEKIREEVFPQIDPHDHAEHKDVRWINPDLLGSAQDRTYRLAGVLGEHPVDLIDAINNGSKLAILYLKPAYAVPNIAGNAFLNLVQQGVLAPANWARSSRMYSKIGEEAASTLDSVMDEGVAGALNSHVGLGSKVVSGAAGKWSKVVDLIFRRAAFIHEARRLGYRGPADLKRLLLDENHRADLREVGQRAKDAIIDYSNMGQTEREVIRRLVFFYPWVKGSTMYAGHFLLEHPVQAGAMSQLGQYGKQHTGLGATPSYLEGSFKVGGRLVNPSAAAVFQTPAEIGQAIRGLAEGKVKEAARLSNFSTPAMALANAEYNRVDNFGNAIPATASGLDIAKQSLVDSLPQAALIQRLRRAGKPSEADKLFPIKGKKDAVLPFVVGGPFPRDYNPEQLHKQARSEERSVLHPHERAVKDYADSITGLRAAFHKVGEKTIPREVAGRLMLKRERHLNRIRESGGHKLTSAEAFSADVDVLVRHGWMDKAEAGGAKAWAQKNPHDVPKALSYLTTHYFDPGHLLSQSIKYLHEHGSPAVNVPQLP